MIGQPTPGKAFAVAAIGIALFSVMDTLMKDLSLAMGAFNALFWRGLAGVPLSALVYFRRWPGWPARAVLKIHIVRGLLGSVVAFLFFWGLARVPLAQGVALSFVAPIIALILAALLLGERIGRAALFASLLAFAGVITILGGQAMSEPGPEAFLGALAILASAAGYAWNLILMRRQSQLSGPAEAAFFQSLFLWAGLAVAAPWLGVVPDTAHAPSLVMAAVLATGSLMLLSWAYSHAEASYLAPVEYTAFIWATLFGWIIFDEQVSLLTVAGAAMIVAGCILSARQRKGPPEHIETTSI